MATHDAQRESLHARRESILKERHLHFIWRNLLFNSERLLTEDGVALNIVHPGFPEREGGPDFTDAHLRFGGGATPSLGDVELHLYPSGWNAHGHGLNFGYSNVILHVAMWRDDHSISQRRLMTEGNDGRIPQLILAPYLIESVHSLVRRVDGVEPPSPPGDRDDNADPRALFAAMGMALVTKRVERMRRILLFLDPDEALYRSLMVALGYKKNKSQFEELARSLPYKSIRKADGRAAADIERLMLATAGFEKPGYDRYWRTGGVRPANHPVRRIRAVARILSETFPRGIAASIEKVVERTLLLSPTPLPILVDWIVSASGGGIGEERARAILFNVFLPFLMARGRSDGRLAALYRTPCRFSENSRTLAAASIYPMDSAIGYRTAEEHMGMVEFSKNFGKSPIW